MKSGDDLSGKTLYFNFPDDLYLQLEEEIYYIIRCGNNKIASESFTDNWSCVYSLIDDEPEWFYNYYDYDGLITNLKTSVLPSNFGLVTEVDSSKVAYQYIKIKG